MTTIIATKNAIYSDTFCNYSTSFRTVKIVRIGDSIYGGAGDLEEVQFFFEWRRGKEKPEYPDSADFSAIEVNKSGIYLWSTRLCPMIVKAKSYAIGSGGQFAIGAMEAGADPIQAIKIAAKHDPNTRAPIEALNL